MPICFCRIPAKELLEQGMDGIAPRWLLLGEDKVRCEVCRGRGRFVFAWSTFLLLLLFLLLFLFLILLHVSRSRFRSVMLCCVVWWS